MKVEVIGPRDSLSPYDRAIWLTRDIRTDDNFERRARSTYEGWKRDGLTHGRTDEELLIHACRYEADCMISNVLLMKELHHNA